MTHPGDLGRHIEQAMADLAGHHVDFIGEGHGDDHVGVGGAGALQHIGVGGEPDHALDVEGVADLANQLGPLIDHGHIIAFAGEMAGDVETDLAGAANDNLHDELSPSARLADLPRPSSVMPRPLSLRCSAERSMPMNSAVRDMLPPKRTS